MAFMKMPRAKRTLYSFIPKSVFKVLLSVVILLGLLVGGGAAYIWYTGKYSPKIESVVDELPERKAPELPKPTALDPDAPIGVSIQSLTSPVAPGENASVIIKTYPGASCTIKVTYDDKLSRDSGLSPKIADIYGTTNWTWTVEPTAPTGKWPVKIVCQHHKKLAKVIADLVVAKPRR